MSNEGNISNVPEGENTKKSQKSMRDKSVEPAAAAFEAMLARVELTIGNHRDKFDVVEQRIEQFDGDELREMQVTMEEANKATWELVEVLRAEVVMLKEEEVTLKEKLAVNEVEFATCKVEIVRKEKAAVMEPWNVQEELTTLKAIVAELMQRGPTGAMAGALRVNALYPESYLGERKARVIEDFLYGLEQYFDVVGIIGDEANEPLHYRVRHVFGGGGGRVCMRGMRAITTWRAFKTELKAKFEPADAKEEAWVKIRRMEHREGHLKEYINKFSDLLLEVPTIAPRDALRTFLDGLKLWAKLRTKVKIPTTVNEAMKYAQWLSEFERKEPSKEDKGKKPIFGRHGGDKPTPRLNNAEGAHQPP